MSQDLQGVGSVSDRIHARYMLERSKRELAATRANIRAYDAANPKSRLRQYLVIGGGAFAAGCAVMALVSYKPSPNDAPVITASKALTPPAVVNPPVQPIPAIPMVPTASPVAAPSTPAIPSVPQATKPAAPPVKPTPSAASQTSVKAAPNTTKAIGVIPIRETAPQPSAPSPTPSTPSGAAITPPVLSHAKDKEVANGGDELGFKPKTNYAVVGIPADGVVMVKKNGETVQQLVRVGSKLPDGEELRAANPNTKEIETSARKFSATQ